MEVLRDYLNDGLLKSKMLVVASHLRSCRGCRMTARAACLEIDMEISPALSSLAVGRSLLSKYFPATLPERSLARPPAWDGTHIIASTLFNAVKRGGSVEGAAMAMNALITELERRMCSWAKSKSYGFDDGWPLLEALEEAAAPACRHPLLASEYARLYGRIASRVSTATARAQLAWGISELSERGGDSARLGLMVARRLVAADEDGSICFVLALLLQLRPELRDLPESSIEVVNSRAGSKVSAILREARSIESEMTKAISKVAGGASLDKLVKPLARLISRVHQQEPLAGMAGLASLRMVLKPSLGKMRVLPPDRMRGAVQAVCEALFLPISAAPDIPVFPSVEAAEAIRDKYPKLCAKVMADLLPQMDPRVQQGFLVCIAEGREEGFGGQPQTSVPRFLHVGRRWRFLGHGQSNLNAFERSLAQLASKSRKAEILATWENKRLQGSHARNLDPFARL